MLDGIGEKTERLLWRNGILSWDDFLSTETLPHVLMNRKSLYKEMLIYFSDELSKYNEEPFAEFINKGDHWRLFRYFRDHSLCIDIETDGISAQHGGEITVVGLYDGKEFRQYVKGMNLNEEDLLHEIASSKLIISFFGSVFDIPFLGNRFPSLNSLNLPHFDLCFASRRAGLRGGLKKIESLLGLERSTEISNLNGFDAVKLWKRWEDGDKRSLDTLLFYNRADTVNLLSIAEIIYQKLLDKSGFDKFYAKYTHQ